MDDDFSDWADELQESIYDDAQQEFSREVFDRWKNPTRLARMQNASAMGKVLGTCGETMEMYFRVRDGRADAVRFFTTGCGPSMAAGSMGAQLAEGLALEEISDITGDQVRDSLGGLPLDHAHCADLTVGALRAAVDDYYKRSLYTKKQKKEERRKKKELQNS